MPAPGQFIPRRSGAHRIACIALYRAILIQCPKIPLPDDIQFHGPVNPIKYLVRKAWKKNVNHISPRIVVEKLESGYAAEHLLRAAAAGHPPSVSQIHTHLRTTHARAALSRATTPSMPRPPPKPAAFPNAMKVLDVRPLPLEQLSGGKRYVPTLAYAEYLPFLRFKRPQSAYLSRVLKQKLVTKQQRMDLAEKLEEQTELGEEEEDWEEALRFPYGMEERGEFGGRTRKKEGLGERRKWGKEGKVTLYDRKDYGDEGPWMLESFVERGIVLRRITGDVSRAQKLGVRMLAVVDGERELATKEKADRRREKERSKRARKKEREAAGRGRSLRDSDSAPVVSREEVKSQS